MTDHRKWFLFLLVAAAVATFFYGEISYDESPYDGWDLAAYREMARAAPGLSESVNAPYAYRILGPYVSGLLPGPDPAGFRSLTIVLSLLVVALLFGLARDLPARPAAAALAALLFVMNKRFFGFTAWDYFQVNDLVALVSIVVGYRAALGRRWTTYAAALAIGCLAKESPLLILPVAFVSLLETGDLRNEWRRAVAASVPALAVFGVLRFAIEPAGGRGLVSAFVDAADKLAYGRTWFRLLVNAFAPVSLLPLVFWRETVGFFRKRRHGLVFFVLVFVSALFGINNERLMAPAAVVFYPLIAHILERRLLERRWFAVALVACGALSLLHHEFARYPLPSRELTLALSLGSLAAVTVASFAVGFGGRKGGVRT